MLIKSLGLALIFICPRRDEAPLADGTSELVSINYQQDRGTSCDIETKTYDCQLCIGEIVDEVAVDDSLKFVTIFLVMLTWRHYLASLLSSCAGP